MDKKPAAKKATAAAKAPSSKAPASKPPATTTTTTTAAKPSASKPSTASTTTKPSTTAKPSTASTTTKPSTASTTTKPSTTAPKTTKPAASAAPAKPSTAPAKASSKPAAASRPPTATATKPPAAAAPKTPKGDDAAKRPATSSTKDDAASKKVVKSSSAKTGLAKSASAPKVELAKSASATKADAAKPAAAKPAAAGSRPATGKKSDDVAKAPAKPAAAKPAAAQAVKKVPSLDVASAGAKGAAASKKSPRSPRPPDSAKTPHAPITRAHTTSEIPTIPTDGKITAGNRSVSVSGGITRAAAPAGRRKGATANPLRNRQSTPITERPKEQRAASAMFSGLGLLASVGATGEGHEMNGVQLRKVNDESNKPKVLLIHVKGRRHVTARVAETHHRSLNRGDAFVIVDASTRRIFEWRGASANKMEIAKAMDLAGRIKNKEFSGRAEMFVFEDGKNDHHQGFWELLGGKGNIAPAEIAGEDEELESQTRPWFLFGVEEKTPGKPAVVEIARHKLYKEMIESGNVYLADCHTEIYMWVGRSCNNTHRNLLSAKAQDLVANSKKRPKWVAITRVIEGAEPEIFKEKFSDWPSTLPITMAAVPKGNVAGSRAMLRFDVSRMFTSPKREDRVVDDGSGKVEIWRVKDHSKEPIAREMYGQFFDAESYVILYTYMQRNREMYMIYFWQGKKSSINEKGSSALLTIDLDDSIGGNAVQIRVVQNKEPKHFMKLFKGRMVVHRKIDESEEGASIVPDTALYHVRGFNNVEAGCDVRAVPAPSPSTKYLNTNDIFILNTLEKQYIWYGAASSKFFQIPRETIAELGASFKGSRQQIMVGEGEEPQAFWEGLGETEFPDIDSVRDKYYTTEWSFFPRLFHCSSASGSFMVEEVLEWDQEDLDSGHLNILDTSGDIFLWTGQRASLEEEKKLAMETVLDYAKRHPARKEHPSEVLCVNGRREPYLFRAVFHGWDESKSVDANGVNDSIKVSDLLKELSRTYTLAELRNPPKMLDSTKLETYLSNPEFEEVFKMDRAAFGAQPLWKQEGQKKNVGLY